MELRERITFNDLGLWCAPLSYTAESEPYERSDIFPHPALRQRVAKDFHQRSASRKRCGRAQLWLKRSRSFRRVCALPRAILSYFSSVRWFIYLGSRYEIYVFVSSLEDRHSSDESPYILIAEVTRRNSSPLAVNHFTRDFTRISPSPPPWLRMSGEVVSLDKTFIDCQFRTSYFGDVILIFKMWGGSLRGVRARTKLRSLKIKIESQFSFCALAGASPRNWLLSNIQQYFRYTLENRLIEVWKIKQYCLFIVDCCIRLMRNWNMNNFYSEWMSMF